MQNYINTQVNIIIIDPCIPENKEGNKRIKKNFEKGIDDDLYTFEAQWMMLFLNTLNLIDFIHHTIFILYRYL